MQRGSVVGVAAAVAVGLGTSACAQSFVNWESGQVHPIEYVPGGAAVLAVNTADDRLEVLRFTEEDELVHVRSIPVGLDPVTVRLRTTHEAWVVNHISDSVSIVDLAAGTVVETIDLPEKGHDVVFANDRAFISVGTVNQVLVYDLPYSPGNTPTVIQIEGEDPRSLATDGATVYAAILNAGNGTTVLHHALVTDPNNNQYTGDPNPFPNDGDSFNPPINPDLLVDADGDGQLDIPMPRSAAIVKTDGSGTWFDDNDHEWTNALLWDLHLHGMAVIDASTLDVTYETRLLTHNRAIDVHPKSGAVSLTGTHAHNQVRFESNLKGRFLSMGEVLIDGDVVTHSDLNDHLSEFHPDPLGFGGVQALPSVPDAPVPNRNEAVGDPRGVKWSPDGSFKAITGRGSNNVVCTDAAGNRVALVEVGQGPTGVAFHPVRQRMFVLNQFDASVSIIDTDQMVVVGGGTFFDPTPQVIKVGRPHFYNTHDNSVFGHLSCQSCHPDGDLDLLSWDLGDPAGDMKEFNQVCLGNDPICDLTDWHPMKGPMNTQTLRSLEGFEPFHWRGDREDFQAFNPAFASLLGGEELSDQESDEFTDFIMTIKMPPAPNRLLDNSLPTSFPNGGDPINGETLFILPPEEGSEMDFRGMHPILNPPDGGQEGGGGGFGCVACHALPAGTNNEIMGVFPADTLTGIWHLTKVPQLRNMVDKDGFDVFDGVGPENRGMGYLHDGSLDTLDTFLLIFFPGMTPQQRLDLEAFMLAFETDTHAGVGTQVTVTSDGGAALRDQFIDVLDSGDISLIAKGKVDVERRGFAYIGGGLWQSDRAAEIYSTAQLDELSAAMTYTVVPEGMQTRLGIDRDEDGHLDWDELDECSDPDDSMSVPSNACCGNLNGDTVVDVSDVLMAIGQWGLCDPFDPCAGDATHNGVVDVEDVLLVIGNWGDCPE